MPRDRFFIVDLHYFAHRAFHAPFADLTSPDGEPTKVTYKVTQQLLSLVQVHNPTYLAIVADGPRHRLRRRLICPDYKRGRASRPELELQIKRLKEIVRLLGFCLIECDGDEADDAIATLATRYGCDQVQSVIVSKDKDLMSLVRDPDIIVFDQSEGLWYDEKRVENKFGVRPSLIPDFLSLLGDTADGIVGVPGWGKKSCAKYLNWGMDSAKNLRRSKSGKPVSGLDHLVKEATEGFLLPQRLAASLSESHRSGTLGIARRLIKLNTEVKLSVTEVDLEASAPNLRRARHLFRRLGFRSFES